MATDAEEKKNVKAGKSCRWNKLIRRLWIFNFVMVLVILLVSVLIYNGIIGYMPPVEDLRNPNDKFATRLFTSDGEEMGRYFQSKNNRIYADYNEISHHVINAILNVGIYEYCWSISIHLYKDKK